MVPADRMAQLNDEYKGRLMKNMGLTKVAHLATKKHTLLDSNMPPVLKEIHVKDVSCPFMPIHKKRFIGFVFVYNSACVVNVT